MSPGAPVRDKKVAVSSSSDSSASSSSSDSSSSDSSSESEAEVRKIAQPNGTAASAAKRKAESDGSSDESSSSDSSSSSSDDAEPPSKVAKVTAPLPTPRSTPIASPAATIKEQPKRFQRVDPTKVVFKDDRLRDNAYRNGLAGTYADKANEDLLPTRGKSFKQEKNKKKRGSYRGGSIDTSGVHSFKFPSDSE